MAVAVLLALLLAGLLVAGLVRPGTRDQDLSARRLETVQAFFAAEAGANMAFRELMVGADEDGDGTAGSISDDGNDDNDPVIGAGRIRVNLTVVGARKIVTSLGRSGAARREITATVE